MKDARGNQVHRASFGSAGREVTREMAERGLALAKNFKKEGTWFADGDIAYYEAILADLTAKGE